MSCPIRSGPAPEPRYGRLIPGPGRGFIPGDIGLRNRYLSHFSKRLEGIEDLFLIHPPYHDSNASRIIACLDLIHSRFCPAHIAQGFELFHSEVSPRSWHQAV